MLPPSRVTAAMQTTATRARIRPYSARPWPSSREAWYLTALRMGQFLIFDMWFLLPLSWFGVSPGVCPSGEASCLPWPKPVVHLHCWANPVAGLAFAAALLMDGALLRVKLLGTSA